MYFGKLRIIKHIFILRARQDRNKSRTAGHDIFDTDFFIDKSP